MMQIAQGAVDVSAQCAISRTQLRAQTGQLIDGILHVRSSQRRLTITGRIVCAALRLTSGLTFALLLGMVERLAQCTHFGQGLRCLIILPALRPALAGVQRLLCVSHLPAELLHPGCHAVLHVQIARAVTFPHPFGVLLHAQRQLLLFSLRERLP
jgi:hypothetical protein